MNGHIIANIDKAGVATRALSELGLIIESLDLEGPHPVIELRPAPQNHDCLGGGIHIMRTRPDGRRDAIIATQFYHCKVQWRKS